MTSLVKTKKVVSTGYLTKKEAFRLWYECLKRAASDPKVEVNESFYVDWGDWKTLPFNEWWKTIGKSLVTSKDQYVKIANNEIDQASNILICVPRLLTPTEAANQLRSLLIEYKSNIENEVKVTRSYSLTDGAEMKQAVVRSYLHTYDAYQRLAEEWKTTPPLKPKNRTGKRDQAGKLVTGSTLKVSGKALLNEVRSFYLRRTEKWKNTRRTVDELPSSLRNGLTINPVTGQVLNYSGDESTALRAVKRYLDSANKLISNAAKGDFPGDY
jgi:hypothetical protein